MKNDIRKYTFKIPGPLQVEAISLRALVEKSSDILVRPHRTDFYHVFLFENCSPTHWVDFNPVNISPYSLLFIDKERVHQFDQQLKYEGMLLIFTDDFFCNTENDARFLHGAFLFNDIQDNCLVKLDSDKFKQFFHLGELLNEELKHNHDNNTQPILKNYLHNFLLLAERQKKHKAAQEVNMGPNLEYTLLFKDLLEKHFRERESVSYYAKKIHISEKRLGQATVKVIGKYPKELIKERILLEAKRLLVYDNKSIKEIAHALGFEEPTNFIKYFKQHFGKTPVEFRHNYAETV